MNQDPELRLSTLPNGLRIATRNMPGLHSAALGVWVNAGGRNERVEQNGIAHFLEHMAFKGTKTRSSLQIAEAIEDVGGYINAYTSRDATAYYVRVLRDDVALAFDVISDIVLNSVFDPREIEIERGVILQEIGQSLDTPDDVIFDWLQEAAYPDQAMGRSILGLAERVSGFNRNDLAGFVAEHYGPEQMIIAAAGSVDHDTLVRLAETAFGHLAPVQQASREPPVWQGRETRQVKALEQAHFAFALEGPGYLAPDYYAAQIFSAALGGGMSSRLFQKIREERGLCYTIFAQSGFHDDTGMLTVYAGTGGDDLADLATITMDEVKRAASDLTEAEVSRVKAQLRAGLLMGLESPSAQAERIARVLTIWGRVVDPAEVAEMVASVTLTQVREHAQRMLSQARPALALYGPVEKAPSLQALTERLAA